MAKNGETFVTHETCGKIRSGYNWKLLVVVIGVCSTAIGWGFAHAGKQAETNTDTKSTITKIEMQMKAQHGDIKEILRVVRGQ